MGRRQGDRNVSRAERLEIRRLCGSGGSRAAVAAAMGRAERTVQCVMARSGGMPARTPVRSPGQLSAAEREEISRGLRARESLRLIAAGLGRAPSTVSREVAANGGRRRYRAWRAEERAVVRARRPRAGQARPQRDRLRRTVEELLAQRWSPQQISARLRHDSPGRAGDVGVARDDLPVAVRAGPGGPPRGADDCLRSGRARRRGQGRYVPEGQLRDMVLISERPAEVEDRAVPGHWEGDLLIGKLNRSAIGTLVERQTRYVLLVGPAARAHSGVRRGRAHRAAS